MSVAVVMRQFFSELGARRSAVVLFVLSALCVLVYGATAGLAMVCDAENQPGVMAALNALWNGPDTLTLFVCGGNCGAAVRQGEFGRLVTYAFLHGGPLHLVMNLSCLWAFWPLCTRLLGLGRTSLVYGASVVAGAVASGLMHPTIVGVGASAGVFGLFGAFAVFLPLVYRRCGYDPATIKSVFMQNGKFLVLNLLISLLPGVDLSAHVGGLLAGGLCGFWFARSMSDRALCGTAEPPLRRGAGRMAVGVLLVCLAVGFAAGWCVGPRMSAAYESGAETYYRFLLQKAAATGDARAAALLETL